MDPCKRYFLKKAPTLNDFVKHPGAYWNKYGTSEIYIFLNFAYFYILSRNISVLNKN